MKKYNASSNARANAILILLFSTMFVLWLVNQTLTLNIYFAGLQLVAIQDETTKLQKKNMLLKEEYLKYASYTIIYSEAKNMGFTEASYVVVK